jgi:hypothetical protein
MFKNVPERLTKAVRKMPKEFRAENIRYLAAAGFVAHEYLGKNLLGPEGPRYLAYRTLADGSTWFGHAARLTMVGETLFLLRNCSGFDELCRRLQGRDFQSAFFELFAARLFFRSGFDIRARPETGTRGEDFDFSAVQGDMTINVEVTGLKPAGFSARTLDNALEQKRKQLPTDAPGVICCVHPESWFTPERDLSVDLARSAAKLFRASERVNAVVFFSERHLNLSGDERRGAILHTKEVYISPSPRLPVAVDFLRESPADTIVEREGRVWKGAVAALRSEARQSEFFRWVDHLLL